MLLSITTTHAPATDLGYLLHKHPDKVQRFVLGFGSAHVFYPEASPERTTACLLLDIDPVALIKRTKPDQYALLDQYVNDRPYVASSLLAVAMSDVYGTALAGRCKDRPELVTQPLPLEARIDVLPVRAGDAFLHGVFEPLGYEVAATRHTLDERFPEWGESPYHSVTLTGTVTLSDLLTQLYVLIPVFDNRKHYFVGDAEMEKLLAKGGDWLASHPLKEQISRRYLKNRRSLLDMALAQLTSEEEPDDNVETDTDADAPPDQTTDTDAPSTEEQNSEPAARPIPLNEQRHQAVIDALKESGAASVLDLGCSGGKLLRKLVRQSQFTRIVGVDVSVKALEIAARRLGFHHESNRRTDRVDLWHGSLTYRDERLSGFDAAAVVEVIEHLDPPRLSAFERVLFEFARPRTIVLTTPNREYNALYETLPDDEFRHDDHRFEWTRAEFRAWADAAAERFGYSVAYADIGEVDQQHGSSSQMGVFTRE